MNDFSYPGAELDLFSHAVNWKAYWTSVIGRYLEGDVLEVGAGLGTNTVLLRNERQTRWLCLEPDRTLLARLTATLQQHGLDQRCDARIGTIQTIEPDALFDAVMYLDVLEHIEDDRAELEEAARRLRPGGHLIVLAPAHQQLYTEFDKAIGHYRRYTKATLAAVGPRGYDLVKLVYLDSVGLLASLANRVLLHQSQPTSKQIKLWDRAMVPWSRRLDPLIRYAAGKSVVAIWRR